MTNSPSVVLTLSCPDTTGIVAAVSGFLASRQYLITEAQHYDDPYTATSFMRTVFCGLRPEAPVIATLEREFAADVGARFGMSWRFHERSRKCRVLVAVSRQGHCLAFVRGVKQIGATAHYVTNDIDEGPIIEQDVERVDHTLAPEELAVIGSELESVVLNRAIKWHAEHRVFRNGSKTVVLR